MTEAFALYDTSSYLTGLAGRITSSCCDLQILAFKQNLLENLSRDKLLATSPGFQIQQKPKNLHF